VPQFTTFPRLGRSKRPVTYAACRDICGLAWAAPLDQLEQSLIDLIWVIGPLREVKRRQGWISPLALIFLVRDDARYNYHPARPCDTHSLDLKARFAFAGLPSRA
jgi:hypothetical protein